MRFARLLAAIVLLGCIFAPGQDLSERAAPRPRIIIKLPDGVRSESVWIRYSIRGKSGGTGDLVKAVPNVHEYTINAIYGGEPAQAANVIVYAPGCQFKTYMLDLAGTADINKDFVCDALPTRTIRGYLPPKEIPRPWNPAEKTFVLGAALEDDWTCDFLLTQRSADHILIAGSCLSASVRLGDVGEFDLAQNGYFEIAIPDFTRDPVSAEYKTRTGVIALILREKSIDHPRAVIHPVNAPPGTGLPIRSEYPDLVTFTRSH